MKNRELVSILKARIEEKAPLIQVIIGPRQVGKTTALKTALPKQAKYFTADYPAPLSYEIIEKWWEEAKQSDSKILAIDEVQKIPGWSEVIKKLWDSNKNIKVILTGSSSVFVEKGLRESLAGRFELIRAEHWNYIEAQKIFNMALDDFIEFGCYPGSMSLVADKNRWGNFIRDSIIEPAIGRDLLQLNPVKSPSLLRQVFLLATSLPAQVVSLNKFQGQLTESGTLPTIQTYLQLLSSSFLVSGIEKFSESKFRSRKSTQKIVVHDNALLRAFVQPITKSIDAEMKGRYFENIVGARFLEAGWDVFYWKDRNLEVDYVVNGPNGERWAIEVKSSKTNINELKGLFEFCKINNAYEPCLLSLVQQDFKKIRILDASTILGLHIKH